MENIIIISLVLWSLFYLWNYSVIGRGTREFVTPHLSEGIKFFLACPFCYAFWIGIFFSFIGFAWYTALAAPPLVLLLDLAYERLKPEAPLPVPNIEDVKVEMHTKNVHLGVAFPVDPATGIPMKLAPTEPKPDV